MGEPDQGVFRCPGGGRDSDGDAPGDRGSAHDRRRRPRPGRTRRRDIRRARADAGAARGSSGCGCLVWSVMWLVLGVLVVGAVFTRLPASTVLGSDNACGDDPVLECVTNVHEQITRTFDELDRVFDQGPGGSVEDHQPY